jgi:hypothetical protein
MPNLTKLDISGNPNWLKSDEILKLESQKLSYGQTLPLTKNHSILTFLGNLNFLEELICDPELEDFILQQKLADSSSFMPNMKLINRVSVSIKSNKERRKQRDI